MSYTRLQWATALATAQNTHASTDVIMWIGAWTLLETTYNSGIHAAEYNLLNTTEPNTPGVVSDFNSVGVKNYDTFEHGILANHKVLNNGRYPDIAQAIALNNIQFLMNNAVMVNSELSIWGTGAKHSELVSLITHDMNDSFPGEAMFVTPPQVVWDELAKLEYTALTINAPLQSGIALSWLAAWKAGIHYGPALGYEVGRGQLSYQYFPGGYCIWNHITHLPAWKKYS